MYTRCKQSFAKRTLLRFNLSNLFLKSAKSKSRRKAAFGLEEIRLIMVATSF